MTKPLVLSPLGLPLSEKQIPQVVENIESGWKSRQALERADVRPRQVRYQAALRPDIKGFRIYQLAFQNDSREDGKRICLPRLPVQKPQRSQSYHCRHIHLGTALPAKRVAENAGVVHVLIQGFRAIHSHSLRPDRTPGCHQRVVMELSEAGRLSPTSFNSMIMLGASTPFWSG